MADHETDYAANLAAHDSHCRRGPRRATHPGVEALLRDRGMLVYGQPRRVPDCVHCGGATEPWPLDRQEPGGVWLLPPLCPSCQPVADRRDAEQIGERRHVEASAASARAAGLTEGDVAATTAIGSAALLGVLRELEQDFSSPNWGYLTSPEPGCGKTVQLQLAVLHYASQGWSVRYATQQEVIASMRPRDDGGPSSDPEDWGRWDLLALDELGAGRTTDWSADQVLQVLDLRYRARKPTLLASNWTLGELAAHQHYGTRISSRIRERCGGRELVLGFNWRTRLAARAA